MKNKHLLKSLLPLFLLPLVSCGNKESSNTDSIKETTSNSTTEKPSQEKLKSHDEILTYDNFIKMQAGQETADPFVYRYNGKYYLYPTTNARAVRCYVSEDMYTWEPCDNGVNGRGYCYEYSKDGSTAPDYSIPFAPEVIYFNGAFYMIFSPSGKGHYILKSENPDGPFTAITDNVEKSIDGSFFISDDERIILYTAGGGCIQGYELETDFSTFKSNDNGSALSYALGPCRIGGWNEGPYLLNRYGEYYMTYTGTNYINRDYRVDYCYAKEGSNILSGDDFTRKNTTLVKTGDDFWGLGHSCTVLAPDMDSYYIAYHNMIPGRTRYLNFSRLSFDGSNMVANYVRPNDCVGTDLPPFYSNGYEQYDEVGNYYLSKGETTDTFTAEFNTTGEGKMIFSYQDEKNYNYILFKDNTLEIHQIQNENDSLLAKQELINEFDTSVNHTYRLQYQNGKIALFFDNMMKIKEEIGALKGGKIGFVKEEFDEVGYSAFSNVAFGSSDTKAYDDEVSLASNYDRDLSYIREGSTLKAITSKRAYQNTDSHNLLLKNKDDFATYHFYAHEDGEYRISMRMPSDYLATTFKIMVDGEETGEYTIDASLPKVEAGDALVEVATLDLSQGQHNISIVHSGEDICYSEIRYEMIEENNSYDLDLAQDDYSDFIQRSGSYNKVNQSQNGLKSDNEGAFGLLTAGEYHNATIEADIQVHSLELDGYFGLLMNVKDYSIEEDHPYADNNYTGYQMIVKNGKASITYADFNFTNEVKGGKFEYQDNKTYHLKAEQTNNNFKFYIDEELIIDYSGNIGNLTGKLGIFSHNADVTFKTLKIN